MELGLCPPGSRSPLHWTAGWHCWRVVRRQRLLVVLVRPLRARTLAVHSRAFGRALSPSSAAQLVTGDAFVIAGAAADKIPGLVFLGGSALFMVFYIASLYLQGAYPAELMALRAEPNTTGQLVCLYLAVLWSPFLPLAMRRFLTALATLRPSPKIKFVSMSIALLILLIVRFLVLCTYNSAFTIGALRGDYATVQVVLTIGILLSLFVTLLPSCSAEFAAPFFAVTSRRGKASIGGVVVALLAGTLVGAVVSLPSNPSTYAVETDGLPLGRKVRVLTYNVHLGFDRAGQKNWVAIVDEVRGLNADIICLQETGTVPFHHSSEDDYWYST